MFTAPMIKLRDAFLAEGSDIRIVGGAVRDFLLGKTPKDFDFATPSKPSDMEAIALKNGFGWIPTGILHGTGTFVVDGEVFEVTTLRKDVSTDGRNATVEYGATWREDALRRDLTINAMSMEFDGTIHDYFTGRNDLKKKRLRFVGEARDRIKEDYLRILRYFRFASQLDFDLDGPTLMTIGLERRGLKEHVSVERIWAEMKKLLIGPGAVRAMAGLFLTDVARELRLKHSYRVDRLRYADDAVTKLALFIPSEDESGYHFGKSWKMSSDEFDKLDFIVQQLQYHEYGQDRILMMIEDMLADGYERDWIVSMAGLCYNPAARDHAATWVIPEFPIRGQDMIDGGIPPGKMIGEHLHRLKRKWIESRYTLTKEQLLENYRRYGEG